MMKYVKLGSSDLKISHVCLGSMTWGVQNNQADADVQIDYALESGINFIDTAEMYAVPSTPETYGATEKIIGDWLSRHQDKRQEIILATKIAGNGLHWIREGGNITGEAVIAAVNASLKRLQTDYIDLYQLHWPNRQTPHFGKHWPNEVRFSKADSAENSDQMLDILEGLQNCMDAGKIRHCGLSDDSPWGISEYLQLSEKHNLPKMVSIQNEFNLLHTKDWPYLIENCLMNDVAYLPWSPLAGGALSGKYLNGARPEGARWSMDQRNGLFRDRTQTHEAIARYKEVANKYDMSLTTLSLAWCKQVDGVTSTIIGATSTEQLEEDIAAFDIDLSEEMQADIDKVVRRYPMPF